MKTLFEKLSVGHRLSQAESYELIFGISESKLNPTQVAALLAFYIKRSVSVEELLGFKNALLDLSVKVQLDRDAIDVCGTGGDHKNTFNISTLSAFVLAASGIPVAKHGNYGSSSVSGSSDILNHFGYRFKTTSAELNEDLAKHNLCFIHAPLFHPALKAVAPQRKELGIRTFFNLLGPLVNPARLNYQYIGVYNREVARLYNYVLQEGNSHYCIVHSVDGYDEVSLTSPFTFITNSKEKIYEPFDLGFENLQAADLYSGTTIKEAADIFLNVLSDTATPEQINVVVVNSALAMHCYRPQLSPEECISVCRESIESKKALHVFKNCISNN